MENTLRDNLEKEKEVKGYPMTEIAPGMYAIDVSKFKDKYDFFSPAPKYLTQLQ